MEGDAYVMKRCYLLGRHHEGECFRCAFIVLDLEFERSPTIWYVWNAREDGLENEHAAHSQFVVL